MPSTIQTIDDLHGPAGRLEALLNPGDPLSRYSALVCHPHPPSGGTMHTKVVFHTMKAFQRFNIPVLRFNFRGTGLSEGLYTNGPGEIDDTLAALDWLAIRFERPILLAGFSFGAHIAFRAGCGDARVRALLGLGMPIAAGGRQYTYEFLAGCTQPKLFLTGAEDPFAPRTLMESALAATPDPKTLLWIEGAEHFFSGTPGSPKPKLDQMRTAVETWLATTLNLA